MCAEFVKEVILNELCESDDDLNVLWEDTSDEEDISVLLQIKKPRNCIKNYLNEVVPSYSEDEFKKHFRVSRNLFDTLCLKFEGSQIYSSLRPDKKFPANKHIAVFLWFAGHEACCVRDLGDRFDLSISTVSVVLSRAIMFISGLSREVIRWPNDNEKKASSDFFKSKKGFADVIGAIDGTHIVINPPAARKDDYIDRCGDVSLVLQGICNEEKKFIDIFVGFPGSSHDSWVFQNSFIFPKFRAACGDYIILGDSAYPCMEKLITPYRDNGHLSRAQKNFNVKLSSCRVIIEHTFVILKQRFRQLYFCKLKSIEKLCHFTRACCVLHNLCSEDDLELFDVDIADAHRVEDPEEAEAANDKSAGKKRRNQICEELRRS